MFRFRLCFFNIMNEIITYILHTQHKLYKLHNIYIYIYISHPTTMTQSAQITIYPNNRLAMGLSLSKIKWCALYMSNLLKKMS